MEATRGKILFDQVRDLYINLRYANGAILLISSFLVWILWDVSDRRLLLGWEISILCITAARHLLAFLYAHSTINKSNIQFWLKAYVVGVLVSGVSWGVVLVYIVPPDEIVYLVVTIFLLGGLVTGAAANLASLKYGFSFFSIPAILPGALYLIYINEQFTFVIGCSLFAFLVFILFIALRIHKTIYYSLKEKVDIGNKLSEMETEKDELDQKLVRLEGQLAADKLELEELRASLKHKAHPGTMVRRVGELRDKRFLALLETLTGGIWDINIKGGQANYSDGWLAMLGYERDDIEGGLKFWESLLHPEDKLKVLNKMQKFIDGESQEFSSSHRLKSRSGEWIWVMGRAYGVIWDNFGELLNIVCMEIFVPETGELARQSLNLINFDIGEWLFSGKQFDERLEQLVKVASIEDIEHSVCHLQILEMNDARDTDRKTLSEVNFYEVGRVLLNRFRNGDAVGQTSGNSFSLILEFCKIDDAWEKAVALQKSLNNLKVAFRGKEYNVAVAIGITPVTSSGRSVGEIMEDAKTACDLAIANSSNQVYVYERDRQATGANLFEKQFVRNLEETMGENALEITVTPLKSLKDDDPGDARLYSVRVDLGRDVPDFFSGLDFEAAARRHHLFPEIDRNVISSLLKWLAVSLENGASHLRQETYLYECAEESCLDPDFRAAVLDKLNFYIRVASSFCCGIPESTFLDGGDYLHGFIGDIREAGGKVALTRASNPNLLEFIKDYELDFLKLDSEHFQNIDQDQSRLLTLKYLSDIVHLKDAKSIVEGAEKSLQNKLSDINIDFLLDPTIVAEVSRISEPSQAK